MKMFRSFNTRFVRLTEFIRQWTTKCGALVFLFDCELIKDSVRNIFAVILLFFAVILIIEHTAIIIT